MSAAPSLDFEELYQSSKPKPLFAAVDGTLVHSDVLVASASADLGRVPWRLESLFSAMRQGKAALKDETAARTTIDVFLLPYDEDAVSLIRQSQAANT